MLSPILVALTLLQGPAPMEVGTLVDLARNVEQSSPLDPGVEDRPFEALMPLVRLDDVGIDAAHSPAVWAWSEQEQALYLMVGGAELRPGNYDDYQTQSLQTYQGARPVFVSVEEKLRKQLDPLDMFIKPLNPREFMQEMRQNGTRRSIEYLSAFSVALIDLEPTAARPTPLNRRVVLKRSMTRREAEALVRDLRLRVTGRLRTATGPRDAFCGGFHHRRGIADGAETRTVDVADTQCFLPATIERIALVRRNGEVFAAWPST